MTLKNQQVFSHFHRSRKSLGALREARLLAEKLRRQFIESLEKFEGYGTPTETDVFRLLVGKYLLERKFELMTIKTLLFAETFERQGEAEKALALLKEVLRQAEAEAAEEFSSLSRPEEGLFVGAEAALATLRVVRSYLEPILDPLPKERFSKLLRKAAAGLSQRKRETKQAAVS